MSCGFDATNLPPAVGTFDNAQFSGYVVSGTKYETELCFEQYNCKIITVYSGESVANDNWHYNEDGAFGVLGMGPYSHIWEGFVDPTTFTAVYSLEIERTAVLSGELGISNEWPTNITFGSANDDYYVTGAQDSITVAALGNFSYALSEFSFGVVYNDAGVDTSEYFYDMSTDYPVTFTTNFMGLGLPASLFQDVVSLLEFVTNGQIDCSNTLDGHCTHAGECSDLSAVTDYYFKFNFTDSNDHTQYIRVPIAAFTTVVKHSGGDATCNIWISYLDSLATQSSDIILGGMFFQEFFGVFTNDYNDMSDVTQSGQLYVGRNAAYSAYLGNEVLATGTNPFIPAPTPPAPNDGFSVVWIVVLSCVCALLLGFLGFALYRWKTAQQENPRGSQLVQSDEYKQPNINVSGQTNGETDQLIGMEDN
jgi:hypothetical protein